MNVDFGVASYLFGKSADFLFDTFFAKLGFKNDKDRKKLKKIVNEFKVSINAQHKENPDFENIMSFWEENHIFEELLKIRYSLNSDFNSYGELKKHLEKQKMPVELNIELSEQLMDELEQELSRAVQEVSSLSQADVATLKNNIEPLLSNSLSTPSQPVVKDKNKLLNNKKNGREQLSLEESWNKVSTETAENESSSVDKDTSQKKRESHLASSIFFGDKFDLAFPDVGSDFKVYSKEAVIENRLNEFFRDFNYTSSSPVRKVRGGEWEDISTFKFGSERSLLKTITNGTYELIIDKVVAFNSPAYWNKFILIQVRPDNLAEITGDDYNSKNSKEAFYAFSDNRYYDYKVGEYRKYLVDGILHSLNGEIENRIRYLEKDNFLIVPRYHPLAIEYKYYDKVKIFLEELLVAKNSDEENEIHIKISRFSRSMYRTLADDRENRFVYDYY
ncbi:hypothetical protein [Streptococcus mutans]|uniref:hypothetical protein n=1 Tax=Streptococcus mutans TaxID=1309 RepID=UPI00046393BD|nr:hypothetical protein [Streptococcus mutans]MCB5030207.1 hypothetical protein [Streptococcus mutans]